MAGSANIGAILSKARAFMKTPAGQLKIQRAADNYMMIGAAIEGTTKVDPIMYAGGDFTNQLKAEIESHAVPEGSSGVRRGGLGPTAVSAVSEIEHSEPYKKSQAFTYYLDINFSDDRQRNSLAPEEYGGVDNIIALLNNGYSARQHVMGVWENHTDTEIKSLRSRSGSRFIDRTVSGFLGKDGAKYGIKNIEVSEEYK